MHDQSPAGSTDGVTKPHPAHIHSGRCGTMGEVARTLADVTTPANTQREGAATGPECQAQPDPRRHAAANAH